MTLSRRDFLRTAGAVSAGFAGLHVFFGGGLGRPNVSAEALAAGYGQLRPDPEGILDLPEGFSYRIISRVGEPMSDGFLVPGRPDGMAAFSAPDGLTLVVRNHEVSYNDFASSAFGRDNALFKKAEKAWFYDAGRNGNPCLGGTSNFLFDTRTGELKGQRLSLAGTVRNCAGGPTPWNSWVTCEETVQLEDDNHTRNHGYNFEVPAVFDAPPAEPIPLKAMGRFNHEAIAVDVPSGIVYQTEDRHDGLLYRYIPNEPGKLAAGGKLQALVVRDQPGCDTRNWDEASIARGDALAVDWLDMDGIDSPEDDLRLRGAAAGAAVFARGEGAWAGNGSIYIACTNGGAAKKGQIWKYTPSPNEGTADEARTPGRLELFIEAEAGMILENCDNLTVAPWGDVIVCEDGSGDQYLTGVTPEGIIYPLARNAKNDSELAGATFSPDGTTLFFNIQHTGLTLALTGPWAKQRHNAAV